MSFRLSMMPFSKILPVVLLLTLFIFPGCKKKPHYKANISNVKIEPVDVKRYDEALFNIDPEKLREELEPYHEEFYVFLGEELDTPEGQQQLYEYLNNTFVREVYQDTQEVWADESELEKKLTLAFRYFKYHLPQIDIPLVYSYISGIDSDAPAFYQEGIAIIGLDMFMGRDYYNYDRVGVPEYKRVKFVPEAAPVEILRSIGWYIVRGASDAPANLLDYMIMEGKVLYFLDSMFPEYADSLKIYYTNEDLTWARENESQAWAFILNNEMLFSSDSKQVQKMIGEAPFTAPFSSNSAPRMGAFHGWQIVREYMRRNKDVSLQQLIYEKKDSREILTKSNYRP